MSGTAPREVQDSENVRWSCLQAYAGLDGESAEVAEEAARVGSEVRVVCTPSGGSRSVDLRLSVGWTTDLTDEELLARIAAARG